MKKSIVKALCCTLVFGISVTTLSIMNSSLTALAMEPFEAEEETREEIQEYIKENKNKIDIRVVGNIDVGEYIINNVFEQSDETGGEVTAMSLDANSDAQFVGTDVKIITESVEIPNVKKYSAEQIDSISTFKKNNVEQTKVFIVSSDSLQTFFSDDNMEFVNKILDDGYSIYFQHNTIQEREAIYHKLGIIDVYLEDEENDVSTKSTTTMTTAEYTVDSETNTEKQVGEEMVQSTDETIVASYVIRNMSGGYFTGSVVSLRDRSEIDNSEIVLDAVRTRKYYTYYNEQNLVNEDVLKTSGGLTADAATLPTEDGTAWKYVKYSDRKHYELWVVGALAGDILAGEFTTFTSYAYTLNDLDNKYYFLVFSEMNIYPNNDANFISKNIEFSVDSTRSDTVCREFGPRIEPQTNELTFSLGAGITNKGLSGNVSISYTVQMNDLEISNKNATTYKGCTDFIYKKNLVYYPTNYAKDNTQQIAYTIHRSETPSINYFYAEPKFNVNLQLVSGPIAPTYFGFSWEISDINYINANDACVY